MNKTDLAFFGLAIATFIAATGCHQNTDSTAGGGGGAGGTDGGTTTSTTSTTTTDPGTQSLLSCDYGMRMNGRQRGASSLLLFIAGTLVLSARRKKRG